MSTTPEVRRMVTREMIEAHYKSIMNTARILLSQGETAIVQDMLSDACRRPYPIPAPASIPEAPGAVGQAMTADIRAALRRAYQLGQTYWEQADSESYKQQRLSDGTQKKFEALVDETCAALGEAPGGTQ